MTSPDARRIARRRSPHFRNPHHSKTGDPRPRSSSITAHSPTADYLRTAPARDDGEFPDVGSPSAGRHHRGSPSAPPATHVLPARPEAPVALDTSPPPGPVDK